MGKSQKGKIHPGADDNASGIGALLEIAEYLSFLKNKGLLDSPLFDERRKRPLAAQTRYRVIERFDGFALLELQLVTGRKHQLRRHLTKAGWPIVGDERYGPKRPKRVPGFPGRLWLHAARIELANRSIEAKLPADLEQHLEVLRQPK